MKKFFLLITCFLLVTLAAAPALAQTRFGSVLGTVRESGSNLVLPGANVVVTGTTRGVATDRDGQYVLTRLAAGTYTLQISYVGYEAMDATVEIGAGQTVTLDITLDPVAIAGDEVLVLGFRAQGQAEALTQQKNAPNILNIVASDQFGRFPDATAPEALQRIPAIGIQRDQGEGRFIQIRGAAPNFTTVLFNGESIPSPEGDVRQIALDAVPVDILESIEVSKAITPDMDADAIGGSVNLVTRRTPDRTILSGDFASGYGPIRDQGSMKGSLAYGTRFAEGKAGLMLNGTVSRRNFGSDNIEPSYDFGDDDAPLGGDDALEEMQVRYYDLLRQRIGLNGVVDYDFSATSSVYLRATVAQLEDTEQRHILGHLIEDNELEYLHKNRTEFLSSINVSAGGDHTLPGGLNVTYHATIAHSQEDTPNDTEIGWIQSDVTFAPDFSDPDAIVANPQGDALNNPAGFVFDALEPASSITTHTDYVGAVNLALPFEFGGASTGKLKFGGKFRYKDKSQDVTESALELADGANDLLLGQGNGTPFSDRYGTDFAAGNHVLPTIITSNSEVLDFEDLFAASLEADDVAGLEGDLEDFDAIEQTIALYAMTELTLSPRLFLLPGVRYERTSVESTGNESVVETEIDEDGELSTDLVGLRSVTQESDYGYLFPMLHLRYRASENTNIRAAVTTALARPNFFDLAPYRIQDNDEVELGNPLLTPARSLNLDLLLEHYTSAIGIFSAGVFYKDIQDPIVSFREDRIEGPFELLFIQSRNGESGYIWGLEFAAQQQLRFLPGALSGLGLYANYTYTQSEAVLQDGSSSVFPGQADHIFNAAVSYERGGFSGQLSLNYTGEFLEEFGGDGVNADRANDIFVEPRVGLDASASYSMPSGLSVFLELNNLLNEPLRLYQGDPSRPIQIEFYDRWGWLGLRYRL